MMYSEFIAGTGCRENEHNYKVYKDLEIMYMNSNLTKEQIYEYGKKLVDNSKSEEVIRLEKDIKKQIEKLTADIEFHKMEAQTREFLLKAETDKYWIDEWKRTIKYHKEEAE